MSSQNLGSHSLLTLAASAVIALGLLGCSSKAAPPAEEPGAESPEVVGAEKKADPAAGDTAAKTDTPAATNPPATVPGTVPGTDGRPAPPGGTGTPPPVVVATPTGPATTELVTKLNTTLKDVLFVSEADFPWSVVQGDGAGVTDVTSQIVAERLGAAIAALNGGEGRTLSALPVEEGDSFEAFFDALASDPEDPGGPRYVEAKDLLAGSLQSVKVFFFDLNPSGDEGSGPIITVVVGRSAENKLVALVTFQVAT